MTTLETIIEHYEQQEKFGSAIFTNSIAKYLRKYLEAEHKQLEKAYQKGFDDATTQGIKEAHKYQ
jgi:hypothetical protein